MNLKSKQNKAIIKYSYMLQGFPYVSSNIGSVLQNYNLRFSKKPLTVSPAGGTFISDFSPIVKLVRRKKALAL